MHKSSVFTTFKARGEWAELRFMTAALEHGYQVSKPWGDSGAGADGGGFDLDAEDVGAVLDAYVVGAGYFCQFKPHFLKKQDYTVQQIDLFAAYVIPQDVWYLIPASIILGPQRKTGLMLFPMEPLKKDRYKYEAYKEAWTILSKSRRALAQKYRG